MAVVVIAEQDVCTDGFFWVGFGFIGRTFYVIATLTKCDPAKAAPDWFVGMGFMQNGNRMCR
jgi:hypothetical protein